MNGGRNINKILLGLAEPLIQDREKKAEIRGKQEGRQEGIQQGIFGIVDILHSLGHNDKEIKTIIMERYDISEEEIKKYL